jgi:hypothetical protein
MASGDSVFIPLSTYESAGAGRGNSAFIGGSIVDFIVSATPVDELHIDVVFHNLVGIHPSYLDPSKWTLVGAISFTISAVVQTGPSSVRLTVSPALTPHSYNVSVRAY